MSAYDNVVGGKLKLKGKALDVKSGGVKKKKKSKQQYDEVPEIKQQYDEVPEIKEQVNMEGENAESSITLTNEEEEINESDKTEGKTPNFSDHLTPAEKRYIEQREKLDVQRHSKTSKKSHRDRLNDFNQYLANLSEHYDIPKVGPG